MVWCRWALSFYFKLGKQRQSFGWRVSDGQRMHLGEGKYWWDKSLEGLSELEETPSPKPCSLNQRERLGCHVGSSPGLTVP